MSDKTRDEIVFELKQLHKLLEHYRPLLDKLGSTTPDDVEVSALGAMLQSFYNGIESIFKRVALDVDHESPGGASWHSDLLEFMAKPSANRSAIISSSLGRSPVALSSVPPCLPLRLFLSFAVGQDGCARAGLRKRTGRPGG